MILKINRDRRKPRINESLIYCRPNNPWFFVCVKNDSYKKKSKKFLALFVCIGACISLYYDKIWGAVFDLLLYG